MSQGSQFFFFIKWYIFSAVCNNHGLIKKHKRNYCGSVQKHSSMRYIVGTFNARESLVAVSGKRPIPPTHFLFQHTLTKEKLSQVSKQGFFVNNYINDPFVNSYLIKTTYSEKLNTPYKIFCPPPSPSPKMTKFNIWYFFSSLINS